MNSGLPRLPADAEKLSTGQLRDTHVPQPGAGTFFSRSTLLIGSRGAGKTFLLRHRKATEHEGALYVNLPKALNSIGRDTGLGGRAVDIPAEIDAAIAAKSASLIAIAVLEAAAIERGGGLRGNLSILDPVLPGELSSQSDVTLQTVGRLRRTVQGAALSTWPTGIGFDELTDVLEAVEDGYEQPLTLLFDRAEDVTRSSINLLLALLDQSVRPLVVIAARPAVGQLIPRHFDPTFVIGDHCELLHLGIQPYREEWQNFAQNATANYLDANNAAIPIEIDISWAVRMARDSVRDAVAFSQIAIASPGTNRVADRVEQMQIMRDQRLKQVRASLAPDFRDFGEMLADLGTSIRERLNVDRQFGLITGAEDGQQLSLIGEPSRFQRYLQRAIRADAFCFAPGYTWHPYELPAEFEVAPLLAWNGENPLWIS